MIPYSTKSLFKHSKENYGDICIQLWRDGKVVYRALDIECKSYVLDTDCDVELVLKKALTEIFGASL